MRTQLPRYSELDITPNDFRFEVRHHLIELDYARREYGPNQALRRVMLLSVAVIKAWQQQQQRNQP